ncbi:MAG: hypothetical protein ACR2HT_07595 [Pyrinomonadaceae bacterium]
MQSELSILVEEINEQILYLKELGVENLDVDLPETVGSKFKVQSPQSRRKIWRVSFRLILIFRNLLR